MKTRTTTKAIKALNPVIISVCYCAMQYLLINHSPVNYTCGVYGWNYDVYYVNGVCICTGYRGMPGKLCGSVHRYEKKAYEIFCRDIPYEKRTAMIEKLLTDFIDSVKGGNEK